MNQYIKTLLYILTRCNVLKTIYINFKKLPLKIALHLPIWVYGKTQFRSLTGKIEISGKIRSGMIKIGRNDIYVTTSIPRTILTLDGVIRVHDYFTFTNGGYLLVSHNGVLDIGNGFIGSNYKIMCFNRIKIGDNSRLTWNLQIYDTSFHYVEQQDSTHPLTSPIFIGNNVWIGNNSTISKGAKIPDKSIVTSHSLVNKDFTNTGLNGIMLAGVPATIKKQDCYRVFDEKLEAYYDKQFGYDRSTHL